MKSQRILCAAMAASICAAASTASADDAAVTHSVQCFLAASRLLGSQDSQIKQAGLMATSFFSGQIFGAAPNIDISEAMRREASIYNDEAKVRTLLAQCGSEMQSRGAQITAAGQALKDNPGGEKPSPR